MRSVSSFGITISQLAVSKDRNDGAQASATRFAAETRSFLGFPRPPLSTLDRIRINLEPEPIVIALAAPWADRHLVLQRLLANIKSHRPRLLPVAIMRNLPRNAAPLIRHSRRTAPLALPPRIAQPARDRAQLAGTLVLAVVAAGRVVRLVGPVAAARPALPGCDLGAVDLPAGRGDVTEDFVENRAFFRAVDLR